MTACACRVASGAECADGDVASGSRVGHRRDHGRHCSAAPELWRLPLRVSTYPMPFALSGPQHRLARASGLACCGRGASGVKPLQHEGLRSISKIVCLKGGVRTLC